MSSRSSHQRLYGGREVGEGGLGVSEVHAGLGVGVELVVDARVAGGHRAFDDDDALGLVDVQDRHAGDGRAGPAGGRVGDIVGPDDQGDIGPGELGGDLFHLLALRVGNV